MIGYYNYTVIATYLATLLGLVGLFETIESRLLPAIFCLLLSGLLDTVDGRIARTKKDRTESEKQFGIQIDSLNDVVCFGVLPAAIAYQLCRRISGTVSVWFTASVVFFLLCGLIRLAFFNVQEEERQKTTGDRRTCYLGLPITASTLIMPFLYLLCLLCSHCGSGWRMAILTAGLLLTAVLYITPLQIKKPTVPGIVLLSLVGAAELAGLILSAAGRLSHL